MNFFLLLDKVTSLTELGNLFFRKNQIDRAVESFKESSELAKKVYPGQLKAVEILNNLASSVLHQSLASSVPDQAGKLNESLRYFQEAKEILDNHTEVGGDLTLTVLFNMGVCYFKLDKFLLAFQSMKDALDNLDMTFISGVPYNSLCKDMAATVLVLSVKNNVISQISKFNQSKQRKAVEIDEKRLLTKDTCPVIVNNRYQLSLSCTSYGEQDEVLKHLEKAREIAKRFDYKCGRMVLVLLLLSLNYGCMGSFDKWRSYYKEAKEMAKNLPPQDNSIQPGELGMIEWMKKE